MKVPVYTWRTLCERENVTSIGLLKLDVEGFEGTIMRQFLVPGGIRPRRMLIAESQMM